MLKSCSVGDGESADAEIPAVGKEGSTPAVSVLLLVPPSINSSLGFVNK